MSNNYDEVRNIARQALLPDFFAVRIDEEKLFPQLQEMVAKISLPGSPPQLDVIKKLAASTPDANAFVEGIKQHDYWSQLRELLTKAAVG